MKHSYLLIIFAALFLSLALAVCPISCSPFPEQKTEHAGCHQEETPKPVVAKDCCDLQGTLNPILHTDSGAQSAIFFAESPEFQPAVPMNISSGDSSDTIFRILPPLVLRA